MRMNSRPIKQIWTVKISQAIFEKKKIEGNT